jgi:putative DNA primase/helicase
MCLARTDLIPFAIASGILSWAVQSCLDWQRKGLAEPDEVLAATRAYRSSMDVLADFLNDCCLIDRKAEVSNPELGKAYQAWCSDNGEKPLSARGLSLALKERGFLQVQAGSNRTRTWQGIGLLNR